MNAASHYEFTIFDILFRLRAERPEQLTIARAFMDAYRQVNDDAFPRALVNGVNVQIGSADRAGATLAVPMEIHRTKHPYWNLAGSRDEASRRFVWPSRGITLECDTEARDWNITVEPGVEDRFAGEAIFHALRGIALYRRPAGNLLHAAAVVRDGKVLAFSGASLSGKTSMMSAMLRRPGWAPFANDRLLVMDDDRLDLASWPSYASYCEGHLLRDSALRAAARQYEHDDCVYRTRRWGGELRDDFDKAQKRTYPMIWQTEALERAFERRGRLAMLVFCQLDPALPDVSFIRLPASAKATAHRLAECAFDLDEPSFLPWHGLPPPAAPPLAVLGARLAAQDIPMFALSGPPDGIPESIRHIEAEFGRSPSHGHR